MVKLQAMATQTFSLWLFLLCVTSPSHVNSIDRHNMDDDIAFELPDLTVKVETSSGQFQLEAFKSISNDRIMRDLQSSDQQTTSRMTTSQLSWVSIGVPMLYETPVEGSVNTSRLFHFTEYGFFTHIQMLTAAQSKLLAAFASKKYNISVEEDQVTHLVLSSFECSLLLLDDDDNTYVLRGEVTSFRNFPLRMDFRAPRSSIEMQLLSEQFSYGEDKNDLQLACSMAPRGRHVRTKTLRIDSHQIQQLGLADKVFRLDDYIPYAYATRDQLASLAAYLYRALNISEDYQLHETLFSDAFIEGFISQTASRQLAHVAIDETLRAISSIGVDVVDDLPSFGMAQDLGQILKIDVVDNTSEIIVVDDVKKEYFVDKYKLSSSQTTRAWIIDSSIKFAYANSEKTGQDTKSLHDQLLELNRASQKHIKWDIVEGRVVPKSLNVAKLSRSMMSSTLVFERVQVKHFGTAFDRKFSLYTKYSRFVEIQSGPNMCTSYAVCREWTCRTGSEMDEELTQIQNLEGRQLPQLPKIEETLEQMKTELEHVKEALQQLLQQQKQVSGREQAIREAECDLATDAKPRAPTLSYVLKGNSAVTAIDILDEQLFVARKGSAQVSIYDTTSFQLQRLLTFAGLGTYLCGLATCATHNYLYISDSDNHRIHRVSLATAGTNTSWITWNVDRQPRSLSVTSAGNILVAYEELKKVQEYTPTGSLVQEISDNSQLWQAVELSSGVLAVSGRTPLHGIFTVSVATQLKQYYGSHNGSGSRHMSYPAGLTADRHGYIIVADNHNHRIVVVNPTLTCARQLPLPVGTTLSLPTSLVLDQSRGRLYVGEWAGSKRVMVFDNVTDVGRLFNKEG